MAAGLVRPVAVLAVRAWPSAASAVSECARRTGGRSCRPSVLAPEAASASWQSALASGVVLQEVRGTGSEGLAEGRLEVLPGERLEDHPEELLGEEAAGVAAAAVAALGPPL